MSERISLQHPEYLEITGPGGAVTRGADQEWFPEGWQRMAGCGPTAAAVVFAYLARAHAALAPLCPGDVSGRREFTALMCQVWAYVTPRHHGLNKPELMQRGMEAYAGARGIALSPARLEIPAARTKRPEYAAVARFVRDSLERECPVAFLNLHNGKVKDLDWWHWVTIVALEGERAVILDSGRELEIDLALWLETTRKRGGLVSALGVRP